MRRPRYDHPGCPEAGRVYIHDDAIWLAGERDTLRLGFIRIDGDQFTVLALCSPDEHAPLRVVSSRPTITEARKDLNREAKRIQRQAR